VAVVTHGALALLLLHVTFNVWARVAETLEAAGAEASYLTRLNFLMVNALGPYAGLCIPLVAVLLVLDGAAVYKLRANGMRKASIIFSNVAGGLLLAGVVYMALTAWLALKGIE
jgi:hypothetical protein